MTPIFVAHYSLAGWLVLGKLFDMVDYKGSSNKDKPLSAGVEGGKRKEFLPLIANVYLEFIS
jgi:hypothetical protein